MLKVWDSSLLETLDGIPDGFPPEMDSYFSTRWNTEELWSLALPVQSSQLSDFAWQLSCPFWASDPPTRIFDLLPIDVLRGDHGDCGDPACATCDHLARIRTADVSFPLETAHFGSKLVVLDGFHRLARLHARGEETITYRVVPQAMLHSALS